ncbi:RNA polymerase sigma-B factor [Labedella gwakjiensis]|uniref:RNA polymerase sigma-B factor n=1 Tax=Labedella gwakjiensis TaxID=390269 RepID=A0A2P8H0S3_9MICO|nr:sigma-70 family RNA polymerase sigma factor [Labedella gwakjiensis]PSL39817.1 RNA polymerase sigma-B factor [Labedella gwakjiensis]
MSTLTRAGVPARSTVASRSRCDRTVGVDPAAPHDLIHGHLALAEALAERWSTRPSERFDLRQVAYLGLVQAAKRFDRGRGVFAAFAASYIRGELMHYLRDTSRTIRLPRAIAEKAGPDGVAAPLSLDAALTLDGEDVPFSSTVGDFDRRLDAVESRVPLLSALRSLPKDARLVVYLRYFEDLTQDEIAHRTGSTQKAVSRLLAASLRSLRQELSGSAPHLPGPRTAHR